MKIAFWGTYDKGKPRVRILLRGLEENGVEIIECHSNVWQGIEDKWSLQDWRKKITIIWSWLTSYPRLILKYLFLPKHDAVFIGYMGHLDVIVIWPFAKFRRVPIIWDAFISIYNTVVEDRELIKKGNPIAYFLYSLEWLACRVCDLIILDTNAHINYFCTKYRVSRDKLFRIFVGVEKEFFPSSRKLNSFSNIDNSFKVLFYGQFIPLHGIEHIIIAAQMLQTEDIEFILIGRGQEENKIRQMLLTHPLPKLKWIPWVPYQNLSKWIQGADVCLGIFGDSQKADQVIPNKVFQIIASGKPLITRDSMAIRELLTPEMPGVHLIPPAQPASLAKAIVAMQKERQFLTHYPLYDNLTENVTPKAIGRILVNLMDFQPKGVQHEN